MIKALHIDYSLSKKRRIKLLFLSVCFTIIGIISGCFTYIKNDSKLLIIIILIYTFFCLVFTIGQLFLGYKKYVSLNMNRIEEKLSYWSLHQQINWNEIRKVTLEFTSIYIELNVNKTKQINLSTSSYADIKTIKYYFFAFCLDKKIPCYIKTQDFTYCIKKRTQSHRDTKSFIVRKENYK